MPASRSNMTYSAKSLCQPTCITAFRLPVPSKIFTFQEWRSVPWR